LLLIFICHLFFRFYNLEKWANFGWDQVDNAWAAVRILTVHKYPLLGMVAKQNSGMYIGPLYYYLTAIFYYFTRLDPIASPLLAGATGIFSFFVIYYVSKNLFSKNVSLISCGIYTFSSFIIRSERMQWPVNFIAPLSLLVFFYLYQVMQGKFKYTIHLALVTGLSFHVHFTSLFYPIIIFLSLPFIPWNKSVIKYLFTSILLFVALFAFQILYYFQQKTTGGMQNYTQYIQTYYHGFHMRRVLQISHDAFIKFQQIFETPYPYLRNAVFFYIPAFALTYLRTEKKKNTLKLLYLIILWILTPWFIFATYSGEISDYYFASSLYLAIVILAYLTHWIWNNTHIALRVVLVAFWMYWGVANIQVFLNTHEGNLAKTRIAAQKAIDSNTYFNFTEGDPQSYIYYYLLYMGKKPLPYRM
jgi:4-amino-4-deoxy-L-arabinose transferase-like glycosyltransferase